MHETNFRYFLEFVFMKSLMEKHAVFPVIIFLDNHTSHVSILISQLCDKLQIILICLYPNSTHLMQPLDTSVFRGLKSNWSNLLLKKRSENANFKVSMANFPGLFLELLNCHHNPVAVRNGFKACGIYEWNVNNIDFQKLLSNERQNWLRVKYPVVPAVARHSSNSCYDVDTYRNDESREIAEVFPPGNTSLHNRTSLMDAIDLEDSKYVMSYENQSLRSWNTILKIKLIPLWEL